jgi:hypothetical protein
MKSNVEWLHSETTHPEMVTGCSEISFEEKTFSLLRK